MFCLKILSADGDLVHESESDFTNFEYREKQTKEDEYPALSVSVTNDYKIVRTFPVKSKVNTDGHLENEEEEVEDNSYGVPSKIRRGSSTSNYLITRRASNKGPDPRVKSGPVSFRLRQVSQSNMQFGEIAKQVEALAEAVKVRQGIPS